MSTDDEFWSIICASYGLIEYDEMVQRCKAWLKIAALEWANDPS